MSFCSLGQPLPPNSKHEIPYSLFGEILGRKQDRIQRTKRKKTYFLHKFYSQYSICGNFEI